MSATTDLIVTFAMTCACGASTPEPKQSSTSDTHTLTFRVLQRNGDPVEAGDTLFTGDFFYVEARVDRPAYVYVLTFSPDGGGTIIYPELGDKQVVPGVPLRLPREEGKAFEVFGTPGTEHIYVVSSVKPLTEGDPDLASAMDRVRESGKMPSSYLTAGTLLKTSTADTSVNTSVIQSEPPSQEHAESPTPEDDPSSPSDGEKKTDDSTSSRAKPTRRASRPNRKKRQPNQRATWNRRGVRVSSTGSSISVRADDSNIAAYRFSFEHSASAPAE